MKDDLLGERLREGLGNGEPDRDLRQRVVAALPADRRASPRWSWVAAPVAGLLAVAIVAGLVYARAGHERSNVLPSGPATDAHLLGPVAFKCALPLLGATTAGVLTFPDGKWIADPGWTQRSGQTWDARHGRWLPVSANWISPDGGAYAYVQNTTGAPGQDGTSSLHVVDIGSGKDREIWRGDGNAGMMAWTGAIYFQRTLRPPATPPAPAPPPLMAVDPVTGAVRTIVPHGYEGNLPFFGQIRGNYAWSAVMSTPPPAQPPPGMKFGGPNTVLRLDLRDGTVTREFSSEGMQVSIAGFDAAGRPILNVTPLPVATPAPGTTPAPVKVRTVVLTATDQAVEVGSPEMTMFPQSVQADSHGIWFSAGGFLWLHTDRGGTVKVADFRSFLPTPTPFPTPSMTIDGVGGAKAGTSVFPFGRFGGPCS